MDEMVTEKTWEEFKNTGLLWWVNTLLHMFGWAITYEISDGKIVKVYPARVKYRGFDNKINSEGYIKVTDYMKANCDQLLKEAND